MKFRITNSSESEKTICLEPIGEEKVIEKGGELYIDVDFVAEELSVSEMPEFNVSGDSITIFYTRKVAIDWAS